jgi:hypothetical protein
MLSVVLTTVFQDICKGSTGQKHKKDLIGLKLKCRAGVLGENLLYCFFSDSGGGSNVLVYCSL